MDIADYLEQGGIKATPNRILTLRTLFEASAPLSLLEIEVLIGSMERSSILRVLNLLTDKGLVHVMEDGRGVTKYEVCRSHDHKVADDHHVHFYCQKCCRVYCLADTHIPHIEVPEGFETRNVNFMLKGICAGCNSKA
ncbi:MAG: transcriptional repressor [Muribaculaceae bacterium]|nr:transcriptional repressor [Muribaculaceae bacterium]